MREAWAALSTLQRVGVISLGMFALTLLLLGLWQLLARGDADENNNVEIRAAIQRRERELRVNDDDDTKTVPPANSN